MTPEERLKICEKCKLMTMTSDYGPRCDSSKYLNLETGEVSRIPRQGWIRGCNCVLRYKVRDPNARCVAGK